jgi:hypothetical protein
MGSLSPLSRRALESIEFSAPATAITSRPPVLHMQFMVADAMPDFSIRHTTSGARRNAPSGALSSLRGQVYTDQVVQLRD